jgi:hypothetical protein
LFHSQVSTSTFMTRGLDHLDLIMWKGLIPGMDHLRPISWKVWNSVGRYPVPQVRTAGPSSSGEKNQIKIGSDFWNRF